MTAWTFENTKAGYGNLWRKTKIKAGDLSGASKYARIIMANEARYRGVSAFTRVPWYFIGALHMRESGCDFAGVLHNGEKIIGKNRKTKLVPAGRGPFSSWEEAAEDALKLKNLHKIKDWPIERMGYEGERFNGLGYIGKGVNSAYLWAGSSNEQLGKYVADHVWDRNFDDPQIGVMTVIKRLCELRPDIDAEINGKFVAPPPDVEDTSVVSVDGTEKTQTKEIKESAARDVETSGSWLKRKWKWLTGAGIGGTGIGAVSWFTDYRVVLAFGALLIVVLLIGLGLAGPGWARAWLRKQVS